MILFLLLIIINLNFHIAHTMSVIFSLINQYLVFVDINNLLKNNIVFIEVDTEDSFNNLRFFLT